jgi:hypothetical protein
VAAAAFVAGVMSGEHFERQQFELAKLFSVAKADEYLASGKPDKAISVLHFAKAYETLYGDTDGMLARAYLANDEPCLAQAFADSHLRYMEKNKLMALSGYDVSRDLGGRAYAKCKEREAERAIHSDASKR